MLDDYNLINDINPFVVKDFSLPGAWSNPHPYKEPVRPKSEDVPLWDIPYKSPGCSMVALGDKTVSFCNTPQEAVSCPMSRPLEPQQNFEPGMWNYYPKRMKKKQREEGVVEGSCGWRVNWVLILLVVLILLWFARR